MTLKYEVEEIIGHLGAALSQETPSDDKIIMGHIRAAYEAAEAIQKGINRHYHIAGTAIGNSADQCAMCGKNFRDEIHLGDRQ